MDRDYSLNGDVIFLSDTHGNCQHDATVNAALSWVDRHKPRFRIMAGDFVDLAAMRTGASEAERAVALQDDLDHGWALMEAFRPTAMLLGNHCWRPWMWLGSTRMEQRELGQRLIDDWRERFAKIGTTVYPYHAEQGVARLTPNLVVLHGYHAGLHAAYKLAQHYADPDGYAIMGHVHSKAVGTFARHPAAATGITLPCACDRSKLPYIARAVGSLRWDVGFMTGRIVDGLFDASWTWHITESEEPRGGRPLWT